MTNSLTHWEYIPDLICERNTCDECHGLLRVCSDQCAEVTIYTRTGTKFAKHFHKECPNRWCRKRFYYGFSVKNGVKVYESLIGKEYLVTSSETAFSVEYCYEITLQKLHNNVSNTHEICPIERLRQFLATKVN